MRTKGTDGLASGERDRSEIMASDSRHNRGLELGTDTIGNLTTFNATFSHRTVSQQMTARQKDSASLPPSESVHDFLSLMTTLSDLYEQHGVLEMQEYEGVEVGPELNHGATSTVSTISTSYTQPNNLNSNETRSFELQVVKKSYSTNLYHLDGRPRDHLMARNFMTELRILSDSRVRDAEQVVTLLGLHWDISQSASPNPLLILERASYNLEQFLNSYSSLPFSTKLTLSLDVASGLSFVHSLGVVHGDVKPQNILVFTNPFRAKIADFGHSILETTDRTKLIGGTRIYVAPEWNTAALFQYLQLSDVYSYGIVFTSIICGYDIARSVVARIGLNSYEDLRDKDGLHILFTQTLQEEDLPFIEDPNLVGQIVRMTVRKEPSRRDLPSVITELTARLPITGSPKECRKQESILTHQRQFALSIPYQAMETVSNRIKDQVPRALHRVADMTDDPRYAAACWELCVCYCAEYGLPMRSAKDDEDFAETAVQYLLRSAESGDDWARIALAPVSEALGRQLPSDGVQLLRWLQALSRVGSRTAQSQLRRLYPKSPNETKSEQDVGIGKTKSADGGSVSLNSRGESILHEAASSGDLNSIGHMLDLCTDLSEINRQSDSGDTPLLQAMRAGHVQIVRTLVSRQADGSMLNRAREGPLHFLAYLDNHTEAQDVLELLLRAGAQCHLQTVALSTTFEPKYSAVPTGPGTPAQRAVLAGNAHVLQMLLRLENVADNKELRTSKAMLRQMLAHAVKLRHVDVMEVLLATLGPSRDRKIQVWDNGRLRTIEELWIHGSVSTNPNCGYNWPEKFARIMSFGAMYRSVLQESFDLLCRYGYFDRDYHKYMRIAIDESRRDVVSCLIPSLMTPRSSLVLPEAHNVQRPEQRSDITNPWFEDRLTARPISDCKPWNTGESNGPLQLANPGITWPFKNHRWAWKLAEWVDYAVISNQRGIFNDLLRFGNGFALTPGSSFPLRVEARSYRDFLPLPFRDLMPRTGGHTNEIQSPHLDYGSLLPAPANIYSFSAIDVAANSQLNELHGFDGTLNYALMYMNTISRCPHRDMSMPSVETKTPLVLIDADLLRRQILVDNMLQLYPENTEFRWTPKNEFEDHCLVSSTFYEPSIICPLYHATVNDWEELMLFLLKWGSNIQERPALFERGSSGRFQQRTREVSSVVQAILVSSQQPYPYLTKLITLAHKTRPGNIISLQDMQDILLHSHQTDQRMTKLSVLSYYTLSIRWTIEDDRCKLTWEKPQSLRAIETDLWSAIDHATRTGVSSLPLKNRRSYLFTIAAMQQNVTAVRTLLNVGLLPVLKTSWRRSVLSMAKSFVVWTEVIPDNDCTSSGIELKRHHKMIAQMLSEHNQPDFGDLWSAMSLKHTEYWQTRFAATVELLVFVLKTLLRGISIIILVLVYSIAIAIALLPGIGAAWSIWKDNEARIAAVPLAAIMFLIITTFTSVVLFGGWQCCSEAKSSSGGDSGYLFQGGATFIANVGYAGSIAALVASRSGYLDGISLFYYSRVQKAWASVDETRKLDELLQREGDDVSSNDSMWKRRVDIGHNIDELLSLEKALNSTASKSSVLWWLFTYFYRIADGVSHLIGRYHRRRRRVSNAEFDGTRDNHEDEGNLQSRDLSSTTTTITTNAGNGPSVEDEEITQTEPINSRRSRMGNRVATSVIKKTGQVAWSFVKDRLFPATLWVVSLPIALADSVNAQERRRLAGRQAQQRPEEGMSLLSMEWD